MQEIPIFYELAAVLALASVLGLVALALRQPLIVAFIATGILAGPDALGLVRSADHVKLLAEIGIASLLFLVGLKLDLQIVRSLGAVAVATGLGQVAFTSVIGLLICLALGLDLITSAYVAVALTFSSTIIIVKLLSDKRELDSLHGRISIGFLIVQDIVVVLSMITLSTIGVGTGASPAGLGILGVLSSGVLLVAGVGLFVRYGAEFLLRHVAKVPDLIVTFAIAWAVLFAALCDWIGLGKELGGLLAGISLASTSYREAIASRLSSLRDFLLLFFFISLGSALKLSALGEQLAPAVVLSAFVLIGNPLIVMVIMGFMGYRKRTGMFAGLTVAQISEFSLIFMAMGVTLGHVDSSAVALVTVVGIITITLSTYMILYSAQLYRWVEPAIGWLERQVAHRESDAPGTADATYDAIIVGVGRYGRAIARDLHRAGARVLAVDFDPEALARWRKRGLPGLFGDATDPEFPASLPLRDCQWVVITTPALEGSLTHEDPRIVLMRALREHGFTGSVAVRSQGPRDTHALTRAGADVVLSPYSDAATRAVELINYSRQP